MATADGSPSPAGVWAETWADACALLRETGRLTRRHIGWGIAALIVSGAALALIYPQDRAWLAGMHVFQGDAEKTAHALSRQLGYWGDYPTYNLPVAILLWGYGTWKKNRAWRVAGLVCLLSASLAGLIDDLFKFSLGRPRPDAGMADGFYGTGRGIHGNYRSFPSGHSASDVGMGLALLGVNRPLGVLATAYGFLVAWSRMELNRHYPSDVVVGVIIGIYCGVMVGAAGRGMKAR